jgi:hypothetical protein
MKIGQCSRPRRVLAQGPYTNPKKARDAAETRHNCFAGTSGQRIRSECGAWWKSKHRREIDVTNKWAIPADGAKAAPTGSTEAATAAHQRNQGPLEEMEGEAISIESFLESIQGIQEKCCAVDDQLLKALSLLKAPSRDETPQPNEEGHSPTHSTSIFSSSSAPQRRRDEAVSLPKLFFHFLYLKVLSYLLN